MQFLISGLAAGSLYALAGLGLVLIYKATGILNFAQGEMALVSAYLSFSLVTSAGLPVWLAMVLSLLLSALLAIIVDRVFVRPMIGAQVFSAVIMTLAVNMILNSSVELIWGPLVHSVPSPFPTAPIDLGGIIVSSNHVAIILIGTGLAALLYFFFKRTLTGYFMVAVAQDRTLPLLYGISVRRVFLISWGLAGILGGIAGVLLTQTTYLSPVVMQPFLMKALTAAVIGGLNSVFGSFVGGLILGLVETLVAGYISSEFKEVIAFVLIFVTLCIRPQGLFGTIQQRRV